MRETILLQKCNCCLTSLPQLVEHRPAKQKVASSISSQGTGLGCGFGPHSGHVQEEMIDVSLSPNYVAGSAHNLSPRGHGQYLTVSITLYTRTTANLKGSH